MIAGETYGSGNTKRKYVKSPNNNIEKVDLSEKWTSVSRFFRSVFLPQGYPESVSDDYLEYQIWDTIQAFCSSITGTLATQAILKGVGVGDESATVLAATMTWLMKDGTGMVGRILFAWIQGSYLDCDCKRWRLFADILNDFAIFLEICAPFFQYYFTVIVCIAGVCKSIVGVAGGSTRAALTQHQARRNNMADVSAKDGSQETLVNLAALICNLVLIPYVTGIQSLIWILFLIFTFLHLFANYKAVTSVKMECFNQARLHIVTQQYLNTPDSYVASVRDGNKHEPVLWKTRRTLNIFIGCSFEAALGKISDFEHLKTLYKNSHYLLLCDLNKKAMYILLHQRSDYMDQLKACFHAEVLEHAVIQAQRNTDQLKVQPFLGSLAAKVLEGDTLGLVDYSYKYVESEFPAFLKAVHSQGWVTDKVLVCADEWRVTWKPEELEDRKMY